MSATSKPTLNSQSLFLQMISTIPTAHERQNLGIECKSMKDVCEHNNVSFMHVKTHFFRMQQMQPYHRLGEEIRCASLANELLALCLRINSNNNLLKAIAYSANGSRLRLHPSRAVACQNTILPAALAYLNAELINYQHDLA